MSKYKYLLYKVGDKGQWEVAPKRLDYMPINESDLERGVNIYFKAFWLSKEEYKRLK